jgi:hypothetical protein
VKLRIIGGGTTVNEPADDACPLVFVTVMGPLVAPCGTFAHSDVSLMTQKFVLAVPLNDTDVVPVKLCPVTVTGVSKPPEDGEKPVTAGAARL